MYPEKKEKRNLYVSYNPNKEIEIPVGFRKYVHYDCDLEQSVIGQFLIESDAFSAARPLLRADMFYHDFHRAVFQACSEMYDRSEPIDYHTVFHYIRRHVDEKHPAWELVPSLDNLAYRLTTTIQSVVSSAHIEAHCLILGQLYAERILYELGVLFQHDMGGTETKQKIRELRDRLAEIEELSVQNDWLEISTILVRLSQHMAMMANRDIPGVASGFPRFDKITGGFVPTGLHYLAGRPASGKTALALKIIINQIQMSIPVAIISLETKDIQLAARIMSMVSGIDFQRIWRGRLSDDANRKLFTYLQAMSDLLLFVADAPAVTMGDIRGKYAKIRRQYQAAMARLHGPDWKSKIPGDQHKPVLWIDYLQLVTAEESRNKTREQEVANISRGLKLLAMEEDIPVIALAQLSRKSEERGDKKPKLSDLRESGSLEQDADGVMLLHRPWNVGIKEDENNRSTENYAELIVAKWRNGLTFSDDLYFNGPQMDFSEMPDEDDGFNIKKEVEEDDPF